MRFLLLIGFLFAAFCVFTIGYGAEVKPDVKKKEIRIIPIFGSKKMATYNPDTGEVKLEKDASTEDLIHVLVNDLSNTSNQLQLCTNELERFKSPKITPPPAPEKKKK